MLIAITLAGLAVALFDLPVETIHDRFGDLPRSLPLPGLPDLSHRKPAVHRGRRRDERARHRSNAELVGRARPMSARHWTRSPTIPGISC